MMCFQRSGIFLVGKNKTKGGCALCMLSSNERGGSGSETEPTRSLDGGCAE